MNEPSSLFQTAFGRQRGAALLIFMLIFFMASMSLLLSRADALRSQASADQTTSAALAQAREALIGRAVLDDNRPGSLPCPDIDDDGIADGNFGFCSALVGRLPWKRLDLPDLRDGEGDHLWYALASELQDNNDAPAINPTLPLSLALDGATNIAAIVFSAGLPLAGQNERPSNDINDYLDGANKDGSPYISGPSSSAFNDKTIAVSRDQLFKVVDRGILGLLGADLEDFYDANANLYPESSTDLKTALNSVLNALDPVSDAKKKEALEDRIKMLDKNGWFAITTYTPAADRKSATLSIAAPPAITCTIAPTQKLACTNP
jgi:hypothetical protein